MGNLVRLLSATALGAVAGALIWAGAADATVYAIEGQDIPPATISGTITTDGTLGALTLANIIGIDLTVSDGSNTVVLTIPYALVGSSLAATSAGLFFDYTGGATASYFIAIDTGPPATSAYCIATGPQACENTANAEAIVVADVLYEGAAQSGEVQIGVVVAPEASTWAMLLIGFAGLGGYTRYRASRRAGLLKVRPIISAFRR